MTTRHKAKLESIDELKCMSEESGIELNNEDIKRHVIGFDAGYDASERHKLDEFEVIQVYRYKK